MTTFGAFGSSSILNQLCNMEKYGALYVHKNSNYKLYDEFDCYDEDRNALNYNSSMPVVAHPPCRLFSKLRAFSKADISEKRLAYHALQVVRNNGGILEHPCTSRLWIEKEIVKPGTTDVYGGFTISINQSWFGYYTQKRTRLYIVGISPAQLPSYPLSFDLIERKFDNLTPKQRSESTNQLIEWFLEILHLIYQNKKKNSIKI